MGKLMDLVGDVYGELTVVKEGGRTKSNMRTWICRCSCGSKLIVQHGNLRNGHTTSCGCTFGVHKMSNTRIYKTWCNINARCGMNEFEGHVDYAGRGIKVCERWHESFANFYDDMGEIPEGCSIDRIDVNGDYSPENCRWASTFVQQNNRRNNRMLTYCGESKTVSEWAKERGIKPNTLEYRILRGWSIERALETNVIKKEKKDANE